MKTFNKLATYLPILFLLAILTAGWFIGHSDLPNESVCLFKRIFHLDCPGCGLTRSFLHLSHGNVLEAIKLNAASPILYLLFALILITMISQKIKPESFKQPFWNKLRLKLAIMTIVVLVVHWILKTYHFFSVTSFASYVDELLSSNEFWLFIL